MENRKTWSKSECLEAALKCTNRSEFQLKYRKQYDFAWRNKFLNNICSHMSNKKQSKITFEKCFKIALKHNSRSSFKKIIKVYIKHLVKMDGLMIFVNI